MFSRHRWVYYKNLFCWAVIHFTHWTMYLGILASLGFIVVKDPWYHALPWLMVLSNPLLGGVHCAYNNIENRYRLALGWQVIEHNFLPTALQELQTFIKAIRR